MSMAGIMGVVKRLLPWALMFIAAVFIIILVFAASDYFYRLDAATSLLPGGEDGG